jgi:hypothetical protein
MAKTGKRALGLLLATTSLGCALAAACGPSAPPATSPTAAAPSASATAAPSPTTGEPAPSPGATAPPSVSVEIVPSKMIADIKAIGIDLDKAPNLAAIDLPHKRKLMPFFVKALGMSNCAGCHLPGDFKASTHNKDMASAMWTHFVQGLRAKGGGALFCDSCHQGRQKLLARGDKKALAKFMDANYQDKLERADKKDHSCERCHSDPFEGKVFAKLWGIRP